MIMGLCQSFQWRRWRPVEGEEDGRFSACFERVCVKFYRFDQTPLQTLLKNTSWVQPEDLSRFLFAARSGLNNTFE